MTAIRQIKGKRCLPGSWPPVFPMPQAAGKPEENKAEVPL